MDFAALKGVTLSPRGGMQVQTAAAAPQSVGIVQGGARTRPITIMASKASPKTVARRIARKVGLNKAMAQRL